MRGPRETPPPAQPLEQDTAPAGPLGQPADQPQEEFAWPPEWLAWDSLEEYQAATTSNTPNWLSEQAFDQTTEVTPQASEPQATEPPIEPPLGAPAPPSAPALEVPTELAYQPLAPLAEDTPAWLAEPEFEQPYVPYEQPAYVPYEQQYEEPPAQQVEPAPEVPYYAPAEPVAPVEADVVAPYDAAVTPPAFDANEIDLTACPRCGAPLREGQMVCNRCGLDLTEVPVVAPAVAPVVLPAVSPLASTAPLTPIEHVGPSGATGAARSRVTAPLVMSGDVATGGAGTAPPGPPTTLVATGGSRDRGRILPAILVVVTVLLLALAVLLAGMNRNNVAGDSTAVSTVAVVAAGGTQTPTVPGPSGTSTQVAVLPPTWTPSGGEGVATTGVTTVLPSETAEVPPSDTPAPPAASDTPAAPPVTDTPVPPPPTNTQIAPTDTALPPTVAPTLPPSNTPVPPTVAPTSPPPTAAPANTPNIPRPANTPTTRPTSRPTAKPNPTSTPRSPTPRPTPRPTPQPTAAPNVQLALGSGARINGWNAAAVRVATVSELQSPNPGVKYQPRGTYWLVQVNATNTTDQPRSLADTIDFVLKDADGNLYAELTDHGRSPGVREISVMQGYSYLDQVIPPGQTTSVLLIWDIPTGTQPTQVIGRVLVPGGVSPNGQVAWNLR